MITLTALTGDETRHPRPGQAPRSATAIAFAVPCPVPGQRGHAPVNSTRATRSKLRHRPSLSSSLPTSHLRCPLRWPFPSLAIAISSRRRGLESSRHNAVLVWAGNLAPRLPPGNTTHGEHVQFGPPQSYHHHHLQGLLSPTAVLHALRSLTSGPCGIAASTPPSYLLQHLYSQFRQRFEQVHCLLCFALRTFTHTSPSGATASSVFMTTSWRRHITAATLTQHTVTQQIIQGICKKRDTGLSAAVARPQSPEWS